ncbi:MAG: AAA family ATPase [Flavobacteriales bacterium]|nr:AAA family ATPase [Flavobacteriales bacterium]
MQATNPIIGRKEECDLLLSALRTPRPELIAVFGRRRIGKTFLIRNLYKEHVLMEWSGIHRGTLGDQLKAFHEAFKKKRKNAPLPTDWMDAFALLAKHISEQRSRKKKVIFIDEFPWLDSRRSRFLSAFSHFWNSFASTRNDLVVVICGSAASYMIDNVINHKGGLHNRITQRIHLRPFDLHETELLLRQNKVKLTRYDILQLYMAMGGVPYYLQMVEPGESVAPGHRPPLLRPQRLPAGSSTMCSPRCSTSRRTTTPSCAPCPRCGRALRAHRCWPRANWHRAERSPAR